MGTLVANGLVTNRISISLLKRTLVKTLSRKFYGFFAKRFGDLADICFQDSIIIFYICIIMFSKVVHMG